MNNRLLIPLVLFVAIVVMLLLVGYSLINPGVSNTLATRTRVAVVQHAAEVRQTETRAAEATQTRVAFAATETARPTNTLPPSATPTPTDTPTLVPTDTATPTVTPPPTTTATPAPSLSACAATTDGTARLAYERPGGARLATSRELPPGSAVTVGGQVPGNSWYYITFGDGQFGWIRKDFVRLTDPACGVVTFSLAYLLDMDASAGRLALIEENFADNTYQWTANGAVVSSRTTGANEGALPPGEAVLTSRNRNAVLLQPSSTALANQTGPFTAIMAFTRRPLELPSAVGLRFRVSAAGALKVTVDSECMVRFYENDQLLHERQALPAVNDCNDDIPDDLEVRMDDSYRVSVTVNGAEPVDATFKDPNGLFAGGGIDVEVVNTEFALLYFLVSQP